MAATAEIDEDSWLYGGPYGANSKDVDGVDPKGGDGRRSGSPLLDYLDDVIVTSGVKQQLRPNRIVSVSSNLQPKATTSSEGAKTPVVDEDGVFDKGEGEGEDGSQESKPGEEEEEEESESDDEDDVQIHIGPIDTQTTPFYPGRLPSSSGLTGPKKVEVDAVPTIGGQTLFEVDLDSADKPWRQPGADITDYFNYGFTEETWRLYCDKQRRTKAEVAQLNKIAVHTSRIGTLTRSGAITTIPSLAGSTLPPPHMHPFTLPPTGLPFHPTLLPPPHLPHLPPMLPEGTSSHDFSGHTLNDRDDGGKTPEPGDEKEGSDGRATPGVDQEIQDLLPHTGKVPLLPPPPTSLAPPHFSMPRTSSSGGPDVANAMAAMLRTFRPPDPSFPSFLPPPGFPPPFHPQLPGGEFRPRVPPFHGGPPPPFPLLPGGPLDVQGMLPPLDERGLPIHPELALPGGTWDPSMGPPPPELFQMMAPRGSRSPSRSGSSGRSHSRSRSSSYDDRSRGRHREKRTRRHSRSRSHSRDRHARSSRRSHRSNHHRSERHERDRDRDRDRERERERERDRRRREERSRRERSRRHRSSSRDREEDRGSTGGGGRTRDRKTKEAPPREELSRSHTPA